MTLPASIPSPSPDWQGFNLGDGLRDIGWKSFGLNINLTFFELFVLIGIIVAAIVTARRLRERGADGGLVLDIGLWAFVFGIIGARIWYVLTHLSTYFAPGANPLSVLWVWQDGGIAFYGGLALGVVGAAIGARITGLRLATFLDSVAPGLLLAQGIARLGDFVNQSNFGLPTWLPWGITMTTPTAEHPNPALPLGLPSDTAFHPTFAYELVWDVIGFILLIAISRSKTLQWGKVFALYLVWYGLGRAWIESLRIDPTLVVAGLRANVWVSFLAVLLGLILLGVLARRHPGRQPSAYHAGRQPQAEPAVHSDDTYPDTDDDGNDAGLVTTTAPGTQAAEKSVTSEAGKS